MQLLDGQQEAPVNTVLLQHPQNFSRGTRQYTFHTFTRSVKDVYTSLACFQDFSKVCWSGNLFCSTTAATKTALGISQLWFSYFRGIMACILPGRLSAKMRGSWFIHSCLPFCVWRWSICQSFSVLPKRHTTRHTTIWRSKFSKFTIKLFAFRFDLGFSSGIRELTDAQFYGIFNLCKVKTSRLKNLAQFFKVRCQCWQKESSLFNFFVFISRSKITHIASFLSSDNCFSAAQIAKISLLILIAASFDNHLVLNARCNCRRSVLVVVWCIAMQADRNGETVKHAHNWSVFALLYTVLYKSAAVY